jgi:hypothetical protein
MVRDGRLEVALAREFQRAAAEERVALEVVRVVAQLVPVNPLALEIRRVLDEMRRDVGPELFRLLGDAAVLGRHDHHFDALPAQRQRQGPRHVS